MTVKVDYPSIKEHAA